MSNAGTSLDRKVSTPLASEEHTSLRIDMCEWLLLGDMGATCYYVSVLTGAPYFEKYLAGDMEPARKLAVNLTNGASEAFNFELQSVGAMWPMFAREFNRQYPRLKVERKWTKENEAIVCLLNNPTLDDEQIAKAVPTTVKQLARFTNFNLLGRYLKRRARKK